MRVVVRVRGCQTRLNQKQPNNFHSASQIMGGCVAFGVYFARLNDVVLGTPRVFECAECVSKLSKFSSSPSHRDANCTLIIYMDIPQVFVNKITRHLDSETRCQCPSCW